MNSLNKKFLLYNLLGLVILAFLTSITISIINNIQINKRIKQIENQSLIINNFLTSSSFIQNDNLDIDPNIILEKIELQNVSILILDDFKNVLFDTKGYDLEYNDISPIDNIEIEKIDNESQNRDLSSSNINEYNSSRLFLDSEIFLKKFNKSKLGDQVSFSLKEKDDKLVLISIYPLKSAIQDYFIVAYEDNTQISKILSQASFIILLCMAAIAVFLILFSFFLNSAILNPIKLLARSAEKIDKNVKSKPFIKDTDKRNDEIGQLSKILNTMLDSLYRRIDNTEKYSADLMHEIRNPLASIKMATDVIGDDAKNKEKFIDLIRTDISRIENIITDYSGMMKDESLLSKSNSLKLDIVQTVTETIAEVKKASKKSINIKFKNNSNMESLNVTGQKRFLSQAIKNIIENALSFSKEHENIDIVLSSAKKYLSISVIDSGPGIKEQDTKRIFERFYSLRDETSKKNIHSGLGLSISQNIIAAHGGSISADNVIENSEVKGAKFIINLPLSD